MTARNLQEKVKKQGLPWSTVKGFDTFTPIGCVPIACLGHPLTIPSSGRAFIPKSAISDPHDLRLQLRVQNLHSLVFFSWVYEVVSFFKVNGILKQDGTTADMIFRIPRVIEHVSSIMKLEVVTKVPLPSLANTCLQDGDLILTGTPSGVGPIVPGDRVECSLANAAGQELMTLDFTAVAREGGYRFQED
jgi:acylpyruvate hydrolase